MYRCFPDCPDASATPTCVAVFGVLAGGTAYAANTVFSTDIVDGEVKSVDIGNNEIKCANVKDNSINTFDVHSFLGADVVDETLEDQDVAEGAFVDFEASVGNVVANSCKELEISGINAQGDHLLVTPDFTTVSGRVIYSMEWREESSSAMLQACNPTPTLAAEGFVGMNLLVFDANLDSFQGAEALAVRPGP